MSGKLGLLQIIDDELDTLLAVTRACLHGQIDIVSASSDSQALAQLNVFAFDLVLLDLDMQECNCYELLWKITKKIPNVPVILLTTEDPLSAGLTDKICSNRFNSCWHLLEKPIDFTKLSGLLSRGLLVSHPPGNTVPDWTPQLKNRRSQRVPRSEAINLYLKGTENGECCLAQSAKLTDVSLGGIGVSAPLPIPVGTAITFSEEFTRQSGRIIWNRPGSNQAWQAGIEFV